MKKIIIVCTAKEWDVLYQFIKDELLENRLTVRQLLLRHFESEEKLAMIEAQIPVVAIHSTRQMHIPVFSQVGLLDARSDESVLKAGTVPGFPVVVVKDNKHVVVSENNRSKYESLNNSNSNYVFDFISDCYDGSRKAENSLRSVCIRDSNMDQKLIDGNNPPYPWTGGNWSFKICVETGCVSINPALEHLKMIETVCFADPDDLF